jgi:hypothetical protein
MVVYESSRTVIIVAASVKEDEKGGQGHISATVLHQSATWQRCEHALFLQECFSTSCFVLFGMNGKTEQPVCSKHSKAATETLEMLREDFG